MGKIYLALVFLLQYYVNLEYRKRGKGWLEIIDMSYVLSFPTL